jgi:hypothetical protein
MSCSPLPLGNGEYSCAYTPTRAGSGYKITIKVGRGGAAYQDLIGGVDADPTDSVHAYIGYFANLDSINNPNPFSLTVAPGPTDPQVSVASGSFLTVSTAGVVGSFGITARDAFENRRPGGDTISVLLRVWDSAYSKVADPAKFPNSAKVTDNSDGSYGVVCVITMAGDYQLSISFSGVLGADSPTYPEVKTDVALVSATYAYGQMLSVRYESCCDVCCRLV